MPIQRVRRVIRKIDPWTVLKVSLVFNAIMALVFVLGTVIFWSVFVNAGIPERINELALLIGIENGITLEGTVYFRIVLLLSVIGTIMMTAFFTLGSVVYNLISDLVGGIEVVVLEETVAAPHIVPTRPKVSLPVAEARSTAKKSGATPKTTLPTVKPMRRGRTGGTTGESARKTGT
jgi:hypothetical protein